MPKISIIVTAADLKKVNLENRSVILIDTLRASTTIIAALAGGAQSIIPCGDFSSAFDLHNFYKEKGENYLLAGEKDGKAIKDFDLGNSPLEFTSDKTKNMNIILKTTNGTAVLNKIKKHKGVKIYIGALVNSKYLVEHLVKGFQGITLVCAGHRGCFSLEDFFTAGRISYLFTKRGWQGDDLTTAAARIYRDNDRYEDIVKLFYHSYNGQNLLELGYEDDIKFAARIDIIKKIPFLNENNRLIPLCIK